MQLITEFSEEQTFPLWLVFRHQPSFSLLRQDIYDHWIGAAGALEVGVSSPKNNAI
jgi:hypothetical protein